MTTAMPTHIASFELLNAEAEHVLTSHGIYFNRVERYERGREILYLGAAARPMTAWLVEVDGGQRVKTEAGWPAEPTSRAWLRPLPLGREAAQADLAASDQDQA